MTVPKTTGATVASVAASPMKTTFAAQTWSLLPTGGRAPCRAFFLAEGEAVLSLADDGEAALSGPSIIWVPRAAGREFRLEAGASGIALTASEEFVWRTIGDSALALDLRSLMESVTIASGDNLPLDEVGTSFAAIVRETQDAAPGGLAIVGFNLGLVLLHLWRGLGRRRSQAPFAGGGADLVQRFRQLVELHFRIGLSIADYAAQLGVTRGRLHDACTRHTGAPPLSLVHSRILEEAQRRLSQTEMSVEQVAYNLGFRDPPYFNRFFARLTGQTPGAFRKATVRVDRPAEAPSFAAWP